MENVLRLALCTLRLPALRQYLYGKTNVRRVEFVRFLSTCDILDRDVRNLGLWSERYTRPVQGVRQANLQRTLRMGYCYGAMRSLLPATPTRINVRDNEK